MAAPRIASADVPASRLNVDWDKLRLLLIEGTGAFRHEGSQAILRRDATPELEEKFFGLSPHLSLVARDWGNAELLMGRISVTDQIRLSRSSRMVMSRVRFSEGRFVPFAHLGLGQWRIDTDLMPVLPRDTELAGQLGWGFELTVLPRFTVGAEVDYTVLYREQHEPQNDVTGPRMWGAFLAMRAAW